RSPGQGIDRQPKSERLTSTSSSLMVTSPLSSMSPGHRCSAQACVGSASTHATPMASITCPVLCFHHPPIVADRSSAAVGHSTWRATRPGRLCAYLSLHPVSANAGAHIDGRDGIAVGGGVGSRLDSIALTTLGGQTHERR